MQRYIKMRTKQNNSHFFLYYSRFAVPLHPQNVIRMKDICCIGHVTKDKIVTPSSTVYMAGGTSFYFAYAINQLPKDVSFSLITAMDPTEKEPVEKMLKAGISVTLNPSKIFMAIIPTTVSSECLPRPILSPSSSWSM